MHANDPAESLSLARDCFVEDLANIDDAIQEELSEWDGPELAEAIRDQDAERVGLIVLRRVGRKLECNAAVLA